MAFAEEIAAKLVASGVGSTTSPTPTIFIGIKAAIPPPPATGPYLSIIETGGMRPLRVHGRVTNPYQRPSAQIVVRASTRPLAMAQAKAAYAALIGIRNTTLSGTFYWYIDVKQEPFDLSVDENNRPRIVFNFDVLKDPS